MRCALACLLAVVLPAPGDASLKQLPQQRHARAELYRTLEKPMQTPLCTRGRDHAALAVLELPSLGVNVLVGESLAVRGELGLFVEAAPGRERAVLTPGMSICCYGDGSFCSEARGDRAVEFSLATEQPVLYDGYIWHLNELCDRLPPSTGLYSHRVHRDAKGRVTAVGEDDDVPYERVLVPRELSLDHVRAGAMASFANDLAYTAAVRDATDPAAAYDAASDAANACQLMWALERVGGDEDGLLVAAGLYAVVERELCVWREHGRVELGISYGMGYWREFEKGRGSSVSL